MVYGMRSGSLALLADAGHNAGDVLGLILAWAAIRLGQRAPTTRRTYGFRGSSILAALANAVILLVAVGGVAWEAIARLRTPSPVDGHVIAWVAGVGIVINTLTALLFASGRKHDLNVRGAFLHMATDAAVSLGVMISGIIVATTGTEWIDPAVSLAVVVLITWATWGLFREALDLALHAVPHGIDPDAVRDYLVALPGVTEVHDLHIWGMSTTEIALTAHIVRPAGGDTDAFLATVSRELHDRFHIEHPTLQVERGCVTGSCALAPTASV